MVGIDKQDLQRHTKDRECGNEMKVAKRKNLMNALRQASTSSMCAQGSSSVFKAGTQTLKSNTSTTVGLARATLFPFGFIIIKSG